MLGFEIRLQLPHRQMDRVVIEGAAELDSEDLWVHSFPRSLIGLTLLAYSWLRLMRQIWALSTCPMELHD